MKYILIITLLCISIVGYSQQVHRKHWNTWDTIKDGFGVEYGGKLFAQSFFYSFDSVTYRVMYRYGASINKFFSSDSTIAYNAIIDIWQDVPPNHSFSIASNVLGRYIIKRKQK